MIWQWAKCRVVYVLLTVVRHFMSIRKRELFCTLLFLATTQGMASINDDLDRLISTLPPGHIHSIKVIEAQTGKVLFDRNGHYNLLPASTVKTITAIAAYHVLGKQYRYSTNLISNQPLSAVQPHGVYMGDLALVFSGDPSLRREDLASLLSALSASNVKVIKGDIWLDGSIYNGYPRAGGTSWDDHNICFGAPVSAMILDRNCFFGWLMPAKKEGQQARLVFDQPQWPLSIDNRVETRKPMAHEHDGCTQEAWPSLGHEYRLEGCIEPQAEPIRMAFAVQDPEQAAARYVLSFLAANDICLEGEVLIGTPQERFGHLVAMHQSEPLPELIQRVLDRSDNLYADSLLKTIGRSVGRAKGSYSSGTEVVLAMFRQAGVDLPRSRLVDGSGLSRYNMLSADDFTEILQVGWRNWGEDAPWLMARDDKQYWLKTGRMSGVNSMVGYAFLAEGEPLIFAVLLNGLTPHQPATDSDIQKFHQQIRLFHRAFLERLGEP